MRAFQRPSTAATPDELVLRHVRQNQYLTTAFAAFLPLLGLAADPPELGPTLALLALLVLFVALHAFAIGLVFTPPEGVWRTILIGSLLLVSVSAVTLATFVHSPESASSWVWLVLPGTAIADHTALRPGRNILMQAAPTALTLAACVYLVVWPHTDTAEAGQRSLAAFLVVMFIGYWESTGPILWRRTADAEKTTLQLAVARERLRISEDVHDVLGRALEVVAFKGELASRLIHEDAERARRELDEMQSVARSAVREVSEIVRAQQTTRVADEVDAARRLLRSASIRDVVHGDFDEVPEELAHPLGRVVREGITNLLRHATATTCEIVLTRDAEGVEVRVRNDGVNQSAEPRSALGAGSGLERLRHNIHEHGGELTARQEGTSFTLTARLPLPGLPGGASD